MKQALLISAIFICLTASAQDSLQARLICDAIKSIRDSPIIYYLDSSFLFYQNFSRFAKKGKVEGQVDIRKPDRVSMTFKGSELKAIDDQFEKQTSRRWPRDMFEKGHRFPYDSLKAFLSYRLVIQLEPSRKFQKYYYWFGEPVFIRNGSLAVFRVAEMIDQSSGYDFVFIYEKEGDVWLRKLTIRAGAW